jgi:anti-sigma regulatory factor (Ser/Thr protein kinase)
MVKDLDLPPGQSLDIPSDLWLGSQPDHAKAPGGATERHALRVPFSKRSVPVTRHFLRDVLREWGLADQSETAELLLSEVVTNAVLHGCVDEPHRGIHVVLTRTPQQLVVAVDDTARHIPRPRRGNLEDEGGRGMFLLEQLALSWGACATSQGKTVWFRLALPAR